MNETFESQLERTDDARFQFITYVEHEKYVSDYYTRENATKQAKVLAQRKLAYALFEVDADDTMHELYTASF